MPLTVINHSIAGVLVSRLRDRNTAPPNFRAAARTLTRILISEATRNLPTVPVTVETPLEVTIGASLKEDVALVPILRAGLGMLDAALELLPQATVGYFGLQRDETTAIASSYYERLPNVQGATVLLLDPMLATGGSAAFAVEQIQAASPARTTLVCVVAAPEGVRFLETRFPELHIVTAALDRELNDRKYILPGLGDFGDRLFGTA